MDPLQTDSFSRFKKIADESLGLRADEEMELVSLSTILGRLDKLYSEELSFFEATAEQIERNEHFFQKLDIALALFWTHLKRIASVPETAACTLKCVPLEASIINTDTHSELHHRFLATYRQCYRFNEGLGKSLFEFMLAHYMEESIHFKRLNRGLRSKVLSYAKSLESIYSIWESNQLGQIWTLPGADLPKTAYTAAFNRLIDGLFSITDFKTTYGAFKIQLNPLGKFPIKFLFNVIMSDPKTIIQEFAQAPPVTTFPKYNVRKVGGQDHTPIFNCTLSFVDRSFEGTANSKSASETMAARNAVMFLMETDKRKMPLLIQNTISTGMQNSLHGAKHYMIDASMFASFRNITGASCSDALISKCLTLKADVLPYSLNHSATNENLAFCGSWLAQTIEADLSSDKGRGQTSLQNPIVICLKEIRQKAFRRSTIGLSDTHYLDIVQAILYCEFLSGGYAAAKGFFRNCILITHKDLVSNEYDQFDPSVPYTMLLQEFVQSLDVELPSYVSDQIGVNKSTNMPTFQCKVTYRRVVATGAANTKKAARQRAAYELLKKLREGIRDFQPPQN